MYSGIQVLLISLFMTYVKISIGLDCFSVFQNKQHYCVLGLVMACAPIQCHKNEN